MLEKNRVVRCNRVPRVQIPVVFFKADVNPEDRWPRRVLGHLQVAFAGQDLRHDAPVYVRCGHKGHHDKCGFDSDDEHVLSSICRHGQCSRSTRPAKRIMNASGDSNPKAAPDKNPARYAPYGKGLIIRWIFFNPGERCAQY